jgi:hypothetical protein
MRLFRYRPSVLQMHHWYTTLHRATLTTAIAVLSLCTSLGVVAGTAAADDTPCNPASADAGVRRPTGADAATFIYHCDGPSAGKWINPYYIYDPATGSRTALYPPDYAYDCAAGSWTMTVWNYSPASGQFYSVRVKPVAAPILPTNCPVPAAPSGSDTSGIGSNPSDPSDSSPTAATTPTAPSANPAGNNSVGNTGPNSNNSTSSLAAQNSSTANSNTLGMGNTISSQAGTGNTTVVGDTTGGNAESGNATALANIANLLQSTSNAFGPDTATFTTTINGDVTGDFMFDPSAILGTGPGSGNAVAICR